MDANRSDLKSVVYTAGLHWFLAAQAAERAQAKMEADPDDPTVDTLVSINMAAAATEAFINELPIHICGSPVAREGLSMTPEGRHWIAVADAIATLEDYNTQILGKYMVASVLLPGDPIMKGRETYEDFVRLIGLRNSLMHQKPVTDPPMQNNAAFLRNTVTQFKQRGWTFASPHPPHDTWIYAIQTPQIARWACRASSAIVLDIVGRLGDRAAPLNTIWEDMPTDTRVKE